MNAATVLFIPHGGGPLPLMNEPGHANLNRFLHAFSSSIKRPDAIVVISAHWEGDTISITSAKSPALLFDYYGFPPETYEYQYPAAGDPLLAQRIDELFARAGIQSKLDAERGFDHGLFVPLLLMYPQADIPCIQISLSSNLDAAFHIRMGQALADLKNDNLLILGSGFSFHNMPALMSEQDGSIDPGNQEFEAWLVETCCDQELSEADRSTRLAEWHLAPHARYCHPREEHLLPLQVCYGIGQRAGRLVFQETVAGFIASAYQW